VTDFSVYQPPGVYVEESSPRSTFRRVLGSEAVVAIAGPSLGFRTGSDIVTLTLTPSELSRQGILQDTVQVTLLNGAPLTAGDDYVLETSDDPEDEATTSIAYEADSEAIDSGVRVRVTYSYRDAAFLDPVLVRSVDEVEALFGAPFDDTGEIQSPLSLAARIAAANGAGPMRLVPTSVGPEANTFAASLMSAMGRLANFDDVSVVVPLPVGLSSNAAASELKQHVEELSANGSYRTGILGLDATNTTPPAEVAASLESARVMLAAPNRLLYFSPERNETIVLSGYYLAAAYAGVLVGQPVQQPLTRRLVSGFSGIAPDALTSVLERNILSGSGVAVAEVNRRNQMICRHGVSTSTLSFASQEISVVRARDRMMELISSALETSGIVGSAMTPETPSSAGSVVQGVLESLLARGVFVGYKDLTSRQSQVDPTVIEVKFSYRPAFPVNYIVVNFTVDTSTGVTDLQA